MSWLPLTLLCPVGQVWDTLAPHVRKSCVRAIYRICYHQALLPRSLTIQPGFNVTGAPLYHGGFAGVWKGRHQGRDVAAKVLKLRSEGDSREIRRVGRCCPDLLHVFETDRVSQKFCGEVVVWRALRHKNTLPLLGVTMTEDRLVVVSEWMVGGNIMEFLKVNVHADRLGLVRFSPRV